MFRTRSGRPERLPLSGHTCRAHNSGHGCHIVPFAWEKRSRLKGIGQGAASSSWNNSPTAGSSRGGLLDWVCAVAPWLAWVPVVAERLEGKHRAEDWATRGPGHPYSFWKRLGSESCLLRRRSLLELCNRLPKFSEPWAGGVSITLRRRCSLTTCLLHGSSCPAHALPSVSADCLISVRTHNLGLQVQRSIH